MSDASFSPSRLTLARQRRGLTIVQLAAIVELTPQSLSNAERGRQNPSKQTIRRVAEALNFPEQFFLLPDLEELQERQLSFRARTKTSSRAKSAVRSSARIAVELKRWIDEMFVTPTVELPSIESHMSPELAAAHVRARWGLDQSQSISNCIHLLESRGIAVFSLPPEYQDVDAFSFWWRDQPFIMLSTMKTAERSRFDAMHELGHLIMHRNDDYERDWRAAEREANYFASAFLMPKQSVLAKIELPVTTDRILRSKRRWKVAAMALAYRLHELQLMSEWTFRQTVIELGRLGYRTAEPIGVTHESSLLLAKVFGSLRADRVPISSIARELHVTVEELRDLTFGLTIQPVAGDEVTQATNSDKERPRLRLVQ